MFNVSVAWGEYKNEIKHGTTSMEISRSVSVIFSISFCLSQNHNFRQNIGIDFISKYFTNMIKNKRQVLAHIQPCFHSGMLISTSVLWL